jgi:hypothetical protein
MEQAIQAYAANCNESEMNYWANRATKLLALEGSKSSEEPVEVETSVKQGLSVCLDDLQKRGERDAARNRSGMKAWLKTMKEISTRYGVDISKRQEAINVVWITEGAPKALAMALANARSSAGTNEEVMTQWKREAQEIADELAVAGKPVDDISADLSAIVFRGR